MTVLQKDNIKDMYYLSPMQEGMLFFSLLDSSSPMYFEQFTFKLEGDMDTDLFGKSFNLLIDRHDILRTVFIHEKVKRPLQVVFKKRIGAIEVFDISHKDNEEQRLFKEELLKRDMEKGFNLTKDIPMRISIIKTGEASHTLVWSFHHIIMDGWCIGIVVKELFQLYQYLKENKAPILPIAFQYNSYIKWLEKQNTEKALEFWSDYLKGYEQQAILPKKRKPSTEKELLREKSLIIDKANTNRLKEIAQSCNTTLNTIFQTLWGILLHRYNNTTDAVFGSVVSGRSTDIPGVESILGLFINTIPVRIRLDKGETLRELLQETQKNYLEADKCGFVPLADINSTTELKQALFDHIIAFENFPLEEEIGNSLRGDSLFGFKVSDFIGFEKSSYSFSIVVSITDEMNIRFKYDPAVYDDESVEKIACHFGRILNTVLENPDIRVEDICLISEEERSQVLRDFNSLKIAYPRDKTLSQLFEEQASKLPDGDAVFYEGSRLNYKELNEKANQLARVLKNKGLKAGAIAAISAERSIGFIIAILAVLKAGAAYLPIDPGYPEDRKSFMLEDSEAKMLLTQRQLAGAFDYNVELVLLDDESMYTGDKADLGPQCLPEDLAYVIYTSGTTGKPKGVMITNRGVANLVSALDERIFAAQCKKLRVAMVAPFVFDASIKQIFPSLLLGHTLYIVPEKTRLDGRGLIDYYKNNNIDLSDGTPMHLSLILSSIGDSETDIGIKQLVLGGEGLASKQVQELYDRLGAEALIVINAYGPTECTDVSTAIAVNRHMTEEFKIMPIGKPLSNVELYILGRSFEPVPVGIIGEIFISGEGVARGYLKRPELNKEKFLANPFVEGLRMYRTGDLARWLPDGNIEFLGRLDHQVKIRGFRIELGEIENQLMRQPQVQEAVVLAREDGEGGHYLCAYIVAETAIIASELRAQLSRELPEYMLPTFFIQLDKLPLTNNGKLDRKALPEPNGDIGTGREYTAPRDDVEQRLAALWGEILSIKRIGIKDSFFELGGHSLKATTLMSRINKEFDSNISLMNIFERPTIEGLSELIRGGEKTAYSIISSAAIKEYYPASSAQKRLFVLSGMKTTGTSYNIPAAFILEGKVDRSLLEGTLEKLVNRHEGLRTSFEVVNGEIVQKIHEKLKPNIAFEELSDRAVISIESMMEAFIKPFELNIAPLFRAKLIGLSENEYILLFDMHHIISDGVSAAIFIKEFAQLYEGIELQPLRIQYKDFSEWQNRLYSSDGIKSQEAYWLQRLSGTIPSLNLPTDYPRPQVQSFEGETIEFGIDSELTDKLKEAAKGRGATDYMFLLAAYNILLSKYTGQEDVLVGSAIAGRAHAELESIIGVFINTLVMRNQPSAEKTFEEFLGEVRKNCLEAYEAQDYQFNHLVDKLGVKRDMSRNPIYDVMLTMQNIDVPEIRVRGINIKPYKFRSKITHIDLNIMASENAGAMIFNLEYCTRLFKRETIERLTGHFVNIVSQCVENPSIRLGEIELLSEAEKQRLLQSYGNRAAAEIFQEAAATESAPTEADAEFDF